MTSGLSSSNNRLHSSALDCPKLCDFKKKLIPRSASVTLAESAIVKLPILGRTRFFRVSTPAALEFELELPSARVSGMIRRTWLSSRAL